MSSLSRRLLVSISGLALTSSSLASSFSASRTSCLRSSVACSFRSSANFWRTSSGISAGSSCTGRASSTSRSGLFFFSSIRVPPLSCLRRTQPHQRKSAAPAPQPQGRTRPVCTRRAAPLLYGSRTADTPLFSVQKRRTQHLSRSFRPHHSIVFDYDPGPLSCVHLHKFKILSFLALQVYYISLKMPGQPCKRSISGILPYKNTQRPPRCLRLHRKGRCVRILLWCEEESCTRNRLRPRILMAVV